jgi:hypothetical protein
MKYVACYMDRLHRYSYIEFEARDINHAHEKAGGSICNVDKKYCWLLLSKKFKESFYGEKIIFRRFI